VQLSSDGDSREAVPAGELGVLETKAEVKANAMSRIKMTAARPWLETAPPSPEAFVRVGRCRQACRNPCLKAQCFVRSIQPCSYSSNACARVAE
jgi:hypothetical protein